jgi:hypothetical protein
MTPTGVGLVLVEGEDADGRIMNQDAFGIPTRRGATAISPTEYVAGAMSRTRAIANGRRPSAIGVTWSDESESEASLFLKSLTDAGFDNIVAVRSPEAGEALARGIGRAVGYEQTAVCLLEPESVVVSVVETHDGAVQTIAHQEHDTDAELVDWLAEVFDINDWHPECLIVVGPESDSDVFTKQVEQALDLPVFAPPEAELALARGAALASAQTPEFDLEHLDDFTLAGLEEYDATQDAEPERERRSWPSPYSAAVGMLGVGLATFVVSVSLAVSGGGSDTHTPRPASTPSPIAQAVPPAAPAPIALTPPSAARPSAPVAVPEQTPAPEVQVSAPEEDVSAGVEQQSAVEPAPPADAPAPADATPPAGENVPLPPSTETPEKPPLLTRILSHVPGLHGGVNDSPAPTTPADPPPADVQPTP